MKKANHMISKIRSLLQDAQHSEIPSAFQELILLFLSSSMPDLRSSDFLDSALTLIFNNSVPFDF